jgi:hypothetical protein
MSTKNGGAEQKKNSVDVSDKNTTSVFDCIFN